MFLIVVKHTGILIGSQHSVLDTSLTLYPPVSHSSVRELRAWKVSHRQRELSLFLKHFAESAMGMVNESTVYWQCCLAVVISSFLTTLHRNAILVEKFTQLQ